MSRKQKKKDAELHVPDFAQARDMLPRVAEFTASAGRAFGAFRGAAHAFEAASMPKTLAGNQADLFMMNNLFMAVIRIDAVMDKKAAESLQAIYRFLKSEDWMAGFLAQHDTDEPDSSPYTSEELEKYRDRFMQHYCAIWSVDGRFGELTKFRNNALAHVSHYNPDHKLRYEDIGTIISDACEAVYYAYRLFNIPAVRGGVGFPSPPSSLKAAEEHSRKFWSEALKIKD